MEVVVLPFKWTPWEVFEAAAKPPIEAFYRQHGRTPGQKCFRRLGYGWIVSAAQKHYGGWSKILRRMQLPQVQRVGGQPRGYRPWRYWYDDEHIRQELTAAFPEWMAWNTLPSTRMIQDRLMGLWSHISMTGGMAKLSKRLGLWPYLEGVRQRQRVEDIDWVLSFYEAHGRWPHSVECPWRVRCRRFIRGVSWHDFCRPAGLPKVGVMMLVERFARHRAWLQQHRPDKVMTRQRVLNHHLIDLQHRFPSLSA